MPIGLVALAWVTASCSSSRERRVDTVALETPPGAELTYGPADISERDGRSKTDPSDRSRAKCDGFIQLVTGTGVRRFAEGCKRQRPIDGPYGEVLDPDGQRRVIVEACDGTTFVEVLGYAATSPGPAERVRVRMGELGSARERTSSGGEMSILHLGERGDTMEGSFRATLPSASSATGDEVSGFFNVCRGPDRYPP